jgi:2,5-diamino-6-(ribosylamino)-4(3H)-pyrimidinone 5'-phosphate reductase
VSGKATRLYPLPALEIPARAIYEDLELPPPRWRERWRPYVIINMVASVDGKTSVAGKAAPLGSETDRQTMRNLRSRADAVMIGASTLRAERLSLGLDEPRRDRRQPLAVVVTGSGEVPLGDNLLVAEGQRVLIVGPDHPNVHSGEHALLALPASHAGYVDLAEALKRLRVEYGVDLLLVEGGPTLNYSLISSNLADELFLTVAPRLLGVAPGVLEGSTQVPTDLSLLSTHLSSEELFLRYAISHHAPTRTETA